MQSSFWLLLLLLQLLSFLLLLGIDFTLLEKKILKNQLFELGILFLNKLY